MSARSNIILRGTIFHFRRGVPDDLRTLIRRSELVRSLATSIARTAKLRACRSYLASESLFTALRADPVLTDAQLARLVQDFYGLILDDEGRGRLTRGAISSDVRARRLVQYETMVARNRDALACNRLEEAGFVTEHMLRKQGIGAADLSPAEMAHARQTMLRAGIDAADAIRARYEGDFDFEPRDRLLKLQLEMLASEPAASPSIPQSSLVSEPGGAQRDGDPLSVVGATLRTTQVATAAWGRQTASQASPTFRLFVDICGDRPLAAYSRKHAGRFRDQVERLPNDYGMNRAGFPGGSNSCKDGAMTKRPRPYSPEVHARAVRMVPDHQAEHASPWAAITA
ncbi:hypothetical protein MPOCJGCO_3935 [Methylobacterium trifolii]|uniref:DUF6538 domain-containing protein n=1 Tax=Methylobacterium trifolii TaxID=1003092 RepID=A0ABQ4U3N0_9HYPH|nr:hypothetical protein MPOCJGCO_3935 [Methylobacterium trifolii]